MAQQHTALLEKADCLGLLALLEQQYSLYYQNKSANTDTCGGRVEAQLAEFAQELELARTPRHTALQERADCLEEQLGDTLKFAEQVLAN